MSRFINRDLSWLAFNHRVLQEAKDPRVPLMERLKFLAIFSSNLDEFYAVRVATLKRIIELDAKGSKEAKKILKQLERTVTAHQEEFGICFREGIVKALENFGVYIVNETELSESETTEAKAFFESDVLPKLGNIYILGESDLPFLQSKKIYLVVRLQMKSDEDCEDVAVLEIPTEKLSRFFVLQSVRELTKVMFLDDVIRLSIGDLFPQYRPKGVYSIKLTRDADLTIDDEHSGDLVKKIKSSLRYRRIGKAARVLIDSSIEKSTLKILRDVFSFEKDDLVFGGRYHNLSDLMNFPIPNRSELFEQELRPIQSPLEKRPSLFEAMNERDWLLHYPYHAFDGVIRLLDEAASDERVRAISITLYRVANHSKVVSALIDAAKGGKKVTVFLELKARFNEESNFYWASELARAGATVLYSIAGLKVHAKLLLIERLENRAVRRYAYFSTGNFNEKTSRIYTDHALFTADPRLTDDAAKVFDLIKNPSETPSFSHLLVAPKELRPKLYNLIEQEIRAARANAPAAMTFKLNSLEDAEMIERIYRAANRGVKVRLLVRGIACICPDDQPNLQALSIVDRFLEHGRVYHFHHGGNERLFLSSADFMTRNLSRRIEIAFPIYDESLKAELNHILNLQFADNTKSRLLNGNLQNPYRFIDNGETIRAQLQIYQWLNAQKG